MDYEMLNYAYNTFICLQFLASAVMCVYGFKWKKGLIATMSLYIGAFLGTCITAMLLKYDVGFEAFWAIPIVTIIFWMAAYSNVKLNQFLVGFLLCVKVVYLFMLLLMDNGILEYSSFAVFGLPIIAGVIGGIVVLLRMNGYVLIWCVAFIGAVEVVGDLSELINNTLFTMTGNISYIFDPEDFMLSLFGVEIPDLWEGICMIALFVVSGYMQCKLAQKMGYDPNQILDDRGDLVKITKPE